MKGLVLKDIYCIRMTLVLAGLFLLLPYLMLMLMGGGMGVDMPDSIVGVFPYGMIGYLNIVVLSAVSLNTFIEDEGSGWAKLRWAMPVTRGEIVRSKFISAAVVAGTMTALSLLSSVVGIVLFGLPTEPMIAVPLCLGVYELAVLFPTTAISCRFGAGWAHIAYYALTALGTAVLVAVLIAALKNSDLGLAVRLTFYAGLPLITAASAYASYRAAERTLARAE